eukprot:TRINITY_DN709_c0_g1_i10.p1 TRINITY_DN709_c0_g1~~TRINITY_DN709_c0_g1_i10.p1  ORF type:complete len:236 (+),score=8.21 TRINITY_DN709_c0_g1_i10:102-809(+)
MSKAEVKKLVKFFASQFQKFGGRRYSLDEPTSLFHHSVQTATLLHHTTNGNPEAVLSGLLHDYGHVAEGIPIAPSSGVDDKHENLGAKILEQLGFPASVTEPIRLHVLAKRYLFTVNDGYLLSHGSKLSLELQGGKLGRLDIDEFRKHPQFTETLQLRQADDCGKDPDEEMIVFRKISDFEPYFFHVLNNAKKISNLPIPLVGSPIPQPIPQSIHVRTNAFDKNKQALPLISNFC